MTETATSGPHPYREMLAKLANDQDVINNRRALEQRYKTTTEAVAQVDALEEGEIEYNSVADIILTSINGQHGLPEQKVRVEYLRADQKLVIPGALGMSWKAEADDDALVRTNVTLRNRYLKAVRMEYEAIRTVLDESEDVAAIRSAVDDVALVHRDTLFENWHGEAWMTVDGTVDRVQADVTFAIFSKALQFNCDIRDYGYLLTPNATIADGTWVTADKVPASRLAIKLKPYTLQCIAALNMLPCSGYELGAWVRAYGLALGIYPSKDSASMTESIFVARMPTKDDVKAVRTFEKSYEDLMIPICANILAIFGLLHLNKDHTYRTNDENMERIGTSYLQTLRTSATTDMLLAMANKKEIVLRTAPHPFGLGQTYWLARVMHHLGRLMPALEVRHNTTPPPVQRVMIVLAAANEWGGMPVGRDITAAYQDKLTMILAAEKEIKDNPPRYSDLYRLYGVPVQSRVPDNVKAAVDAMMPIAYGFAMATHVAENKSKDGIALAQSLTNIEREMKGQAIGWKAAWESYMERLDKYGIEMFLNAYQGNLPPA